MIASLRGSVYRLTPGEVTVDVNGVGYQVSVPLDIWEALEEGKEHTLWISSYIREDRFDLFGFLDRGSRSLFEAFIALAGVGPKLGLELCSVPRNIILQAVESQDAGMLTSVKGIGKKTAEKLLVDLKALAEDDPQIFGAVGIQKRNVDQDAIAALKNLGYDTGSILHALKELPEELETTEDRVAAAIRSL